MLSGKQNRSVSTSTDLTAHWSERAKLYGRNGVLNIAHSTEQNESFDTWQKGGILPIFDKYLVENPGLNTALDFGCGVGRYSNELASRFKQVLAYDLTGGWMPLWSPAPNVTRVCGPLPVLSTAIQFQGSLDFIWTSTVLQHIDSRELENIAALFTEASSRRTRLFFVEHTVGADMDIHRDQSPMIADMISYCWHRPLEVYQKLFPAFELEEIGSYTYRNRHVAAIVGRKR